MDGPTTRKRPTQADVARAAGVSQSVVSLVLNDSPTISVSPATRERVLAAIAALGYVTDGAARSLRTGKSLLVASLIPDITNPFYPAFERGIQDLADANGYDLVAYNTDGLRAKELRCLASLERARVDGLVATPFQLTAEDFVPLVERGIPVVVFGRLATEPEVLPFDCIYIDDEAAAGELVDLLLDRALVPLAMIAGPRGITRREGRVNAYRRALAARGMAAQERIVFGSDPTEAGGYAAARELLAGGVPRAIFVANDMMALGALVALREAGLRVPDDVAVAGFDDITVAKLASPPLTTVAQFPERLGRRAAEMLFERLSGRYAGPGRLIEMPHEVIVRSSAA